MDNQQQREAEQKQRLGTNVAVIAAGFTFHGDIVSDNSDTELVIAGNVVGTIRTAGRLNVEKGGVVEGSVRAPNVRLAGQIKRQRVSDGVVVDGDLVLEPTARLECNAVYETLHSERGAVLAGLMVPFNSDYFSELHAAGSLAFVEELTAFAPAPTKPAVVAAPSAPGRQGVTPLVQPIPSYLTAERSGPAAEGGRMEEASALRSASVVGSPADGERDSDTDGGKAAVFSFPATGTSGH